jgi:hypothetical protein
MVAKSPKFGLKSPVHELVVILIVFVELGTDLLQAWCHKFSDQLLARCELHTHCKVEYLNVGSLDGKFPPGFCFATLKEGLDVVDHILASFVTVGSQAQFAFKLSLFVLKFILHILEFNRIGVHIAKFEDIRLHKSE